MCRSLPTRCESECSSLLDRSLYPSCTWTHAERAYVSKLTYQMRKRMFKLVGSKPVSLVYMDARGTCVCVEAYLPDAKANVQACWIEACIPRVHGRTRNVRMCRSLPTRCESECSSLLDRSLY